MSKRKHIVYTTVIVLKDISTKEECKRVLENYFNRYGILEMQNNDEYVVIDLRLAKVQVEHIRQYLKSNENVLRFHIAKKY